MRLLVVNNYPIDQNLDNYKTHLAPAHHCWGADYFLRKGYYVDTYAYNTPAVFRNRVIENFKMLLRANRYDAILAFNSPLIDILAILKKLRLTGTRLFTLVHHKNKSWQVSSAFDSCIFISKRIMSLYENLSNKNLVEWGPDLSFYDYHVIQNGGGVNSENECVRFFSAGATGRDFNVLEKAAHDLNARLTLINSQVIKVDGKVEKTSNQAYGLITDYPTMVKYMLKTDVAVIPVKKSPNNSGTLCGLTSFLDALGLGKAIIMSDNTNIDVDIEQNQMGLYYKAGDVEDLKKKMQYCEDNPDVVRDFGRHSRIYGETHSYEHYCKQLEEVIMSC